MIASLAFFHVNTVDSHGLTDNTREGKNKQLTTGTALSCVLISWKCPAENAGNGNSETLN